MSIENDQSWNDLSSEVGFEPTPTHLFGGDTRQDGLLPTILIMDDEPVIRNLLRKAFERIAFNVLEAENGSIGLQIFYREEPDVVLVDLGMPVIGGELVVARIHKTSPDTPVIVISGASLIDDAIGALHLGAWDFITKPFREFSTLYHAVDKALERSRLIRDNRAHQDNLEEQVKARTADLVAANVELKREIHGRHEAEKKIRESEQNYRELVETSQDLIWKCDAEGKFTYLNQAWEKTLGYTIKEMLGHPFSHFQRPEIFERDVKEFARHLADGFVKGYETSHLSKSGADVHLVFNAIPLLDNNQNVVGTQGTAYDITERKQAEQELRLSEQRLELAHEATGMGMFDWNLEQDQAACNERYFGLFGLKPQEQMFSEEDWLALVHPDDRVRAKGHVQDSLAKKAPYDIEYRVVWPDGSVRWVHSKAKVFFDGDGNPVRMIGALTDVTERKRAEEDLAERFQFESLLAEMSATFINLPSSKVDREILRWLERVASSVGADRSVVWTRASGAEKYLPSHSWAAAGVKTAQPISADEFPWIVARVLAGESVEFRTDYLPPDAYKDAMSLKEHGIMSGVAVPMDAGGSLHGALSLSSTDPERGLATELNRPLRLVAEVIGNAILRKEAEEDLARAMDEISHLKEQAEAENLYLREEIQSTRLFGDMIGQSAIMKKVMAQAEQVAKTNSTVLILGDTGTGKELMARAIHDMSDRKSKPIITVNCAAMPAALVESELFGREKGAFTGAFTRQIGRFEAADGGTIFLDEVGELPVDTQAKLLRVLQSGQLERLGSHLTVSVDVRIITATNRDLEKEVRLGRFREDLFYRLNVFPITVPRLRDRSEDIPELVWAFVDEFSRTMGKRIESIPERNMDLLIHHSWPGNVRELRNVVERAMIRASTKKLMVTPPKERESLSSQNRTLGEVERLHILETLRHARWQVRGRGKAADILGMNPTTLESRMKKLRIVRPDKL